MTGRKINGLSLKEKIEVLDEIKGGKTPKELCTKYGCNKSTISRIKQQENELRKMFSLNGNPNRKRFRTGNHDDVDRAVTEWFRQMRSKDVAIGGLQIMEKAKQFAQTLNVEDFEPNTGWLHRWKIRENIKFFKAHGEKNDADEVAASEWVEKQLPGILSSYTPENIFNADETGLFFRALPTGTFSFRGDKVSGSKLQKQRLTLLFICNMDGSKKIVHAIGKAERPHCFRGKTVPVTYHAQKKAWMTREIWSEILTAFDRELAKTKRKILLLVDNAACHKVDMNLEFIQVQFLPANTTCSIQPLDQGIIRCFKAYYRQILVRKQIQAVEAGKSVQEFCKSFNVFQALQVVKRSWWLVTPATISNCFKKAGCNHNSLSPSANEEPVVETFEISIPEEDFENYVNIDAQIECWGDMTEDEILASVGATSSTGAEDDEDEDALNETLEVPTYKDVHAALQTVRAYFEEHGLDTDCIDNAENEVFKASKNNLRVQKKNKRLFSLKYLREKRYILNCKIR